jgi:hypothetical protein
MLVLASSYCFYYCVSSSSSVLFFFFPGAYKRRPPRFPQGVVLYLISSFGFLLRGGSRGGHWDVGIKALLNSARSMVMRPS